MNPSLFIEQKITPFANQYKVFTADTDGSQGQLVAFAQQKRLAFKEKVTFYTDENKSSVAFTFRAEKVLDVHGRYLVEDANGVVIGMFKKEFKQSLINSTWKILDQNGNEMFMVAESSVALALFRRYAGWIPVVGGLIELVTQFLKYHFVFTHVGDQEVIGTYEKTTLFRDHYALSLSDETLAGSDWRVLAAMGVALDALQSR
jgi:uncharacterized protein YxjI